MQIVITCLILSKKKYRILFKKNIELNNHKVINAIILIVILVLKIWWMLCLILYE